MFGGIFVHGVWWISSTERKFVLYGWRRDRNERGLREKPRFVSSKSEPILSFVAILPLGARSKIQLRSITRKFGSRVTHDSILFQNQNPSRTSKSNLKYWWASRSIHHSTSLSLQHLPSYFTSWTYPWWHEIFVYEIDTGSMWWPSFVSQALLLWQHLAGQYWQGRISEHCDSLHSFPFQRDQ